MARLSVNVDLGSAQERVRRALRVAREPFGSGRGADCVRAMRRRTNAGMRARRAELPGGGSKTWKKRIGLPWPKSTPPLRALKIAWEGGPGGGQFIEPRRRCGIYVTADWAHVHTGGKGLSRDPGHVTRIRVTEKMRRFLAAGGLGEPIFLSKTKTHIEVPARSHAMATPDLVKDCAEIIRRAI